MAHLEHLTGTGQLFDGQTPVLEVRYSVDVYREPPVGEGLKQIRGFISGGSSWNLMSYVGKSLTLCLEDGRRWDCWLKDDDGNLEARGGGDFYTVQD